MRLGIVFGAAGLGLAACALALLPLALHHQAQAALPPMFAGTTSVYAVPLAGGAPKQVLRLHGQWEWPVPTRDGKALLLERPSPTRTGVWRVPMNGGRAVHVRELKRFTLPVTPNGGFLATEKESRPASGWRVDLFVRNAKGRVVWRRKMPFPAVPAASAAADGQRVAIVRIDRLELVTQRHIRLLARGVAQFSPPHWTHDGHSLLYWTTHGELVVRNLASGTSRVLVRGRYFEDALSPDGRTVYVLGRKDAVSIPK